MKAASGDGGNTFGYGQLHAEVHAGHAGGGDIGNHVVGAAGVMYVETKLLEAFHEDAAALCKFIHHAVQPFLFIT